MDTNCCIFTGRLTKDAEMRTVAGGLKIVSFSLAFSEPRKSKTVEGQHEYYSNYVNCTIFGNYGEVLFPALKKGQEATVTTRLHQSRWEENGVKRQSYEFVVNNMILQRPPKAGGNIVSNNNLPPSPNPDLSFEPQELDNERRPIY